MKGAGRVPMTGIEPVEAPFGLSYEGGDLGFKERRIGRHRGLRRIFFGGLCRREICLVRLSVLDFPVAEQLVRPGDLAAFDRLQDC